VLSADWTTAGGERVVKSWLRLKTNEGRRPAVIVAQNDEMASGARRAALAHDPEWRGVPVLGCDGLPEHGQAMVKSGEMAATVILPASAGRAVELVAEWLQESRAPPAEVVLTPQSFPPESELRRR
jgi:ribose transport system substrate-binding protein